MRTPTGCCASPSPLDDPGPEDGRAARGVPRVPADYLKRPSPLRLALRARLREDGRYAHPSPLTTLTTNNCADRLNRPNGTRRPRGASRRRASRRSRVRSASGLPCLPRRSQLVQWRRDRTGRHAFVGGLGLGRPSVTQGGRRPLACVDMAGDPKAAAEGSCVSRTVGAGGSGP